MGVIKTVGNREEQGGVGRNYATILKIWQTTKAKSRLRVGSQESLRRREF